MAIGKFHGVIRPTTPTGSRVISTSILGHRGELLAGNPQRLPGKEDKDLSGANDLTDPLGQNLALLAGEQPAELLLAGQDLVGDLLERFVAYLGAGVRPGRKRGFRRLDRSVCIILRAARVFADDVAGVGRIDVQRRFRRFAPATSDKILVNTHGANTSAPANPLTYVGIQPRVWFFVSWSKLALSSVRDPGLSSLFVM